VTSRRRTVGLGILVVALLVAGGVTAAFPRQTRAYLTHWKGSPTSTSPYRPPAREGLLLRIAVAGDVGENVSRLRRTAAAMVATGPYDVLLLLGDNVYPDGDPGRVDEAVLEPFAGVLEQGAELRAILGNHDVLEGHADAQLAALGQRSRWWSVEHAGVLLVGLDSTDPANPAQLRWLRRTLAGSDATWKIAALHHPPYSAGFQGSSDEARAAFSPILAELGVRLVLSGHDHDYQRTVPIDGVTYVVSGAAASARRTSSRDFTASSFSWHHFVELDVYDDRIEGRAVNQDRRTADRWTLRR